MKRASIWASVAIAIVACGGGGPGDVGSATTDGGSTSDGGARDGAADVTKVDGSGGGVGCRKDVECKSGFETCVAPGQPQCGGPEPVEHCKGDAECADAGSGLVCVSLGCGATSCNPKCTSDGNCVTVPAGLKSCNVTSGHCEPKTCTASSCPVDFTCSGDPNAGCVRKSCSNDGECSGACVNGLCWSGPGKCMGIPD